MFGNEYEKYYCLKFLSRLCLSRDIVLDIVNDLEFSNILNRLAVKSTQSNKYEYYSQLVQWNLSMEKKINNLNHT